MNMQSPFITPMLQYPVTNSPPPLPLGLNSLYCPYLGAVFPAPTTPSSTTRLKSYGDSFSTILSEALATGSSDQGPIDNETTSFSISVWSSVTEESIYEYHYEAPGNKGTLTSENLDGDTYYRIASISKLYTVYTYLAALGEEHLDESVTKFIPELAAADKKFENGVDDFRWQDITLRSLASQLSGVSRDYGEGDITAFIKNDTQLASHGLPTPMPRPTCAPFSEDLRSCNRSEYLSGLTPRHPLTAPHHTPLYSNTNFALLAYALSSILSSPFSSILSSYLLTPLNLTRTTLSMPPSTNNSIIIPHSHWSADAGQDAAAGGMYSSLFDLSNTGRAILRSTLLHTTLTRKWLKPLTHTSDPQTSVGMPWEIFRIETPLSKHTRNTRLVDVYTKLGDVNGYSSLLLLDPDHEIGITVLTAGNGSAIMRATLAEMMIAHFISGAEEVARESALEVYAGTYVDTSTNSSMTIGANPARPGLSIESWTSRDADMMTSIAYLYHATPGPGIDLRLYPIGLMDGGRIAFRMQASKPGRWSGMFGCMSWIGVDSFTYGNVALDEFVFVVENGKAVSVEPRAFREVLTRR